MSGPDVPGTGSITHKGRSRCAQQYAMDLAKEKGVSRSEVSRDVFMRLHCSNGKFVGDKSTRIAEQVRKKVEELKQSLPDNLDGANGGSIKEAHDWEKEEQDRKKMN